MGIGKRIKEARLKAGLTQEELGKLIGVTGSSITNYEKETSHPKESILYSLIRVLGVDANFLFQDCVRIKPYDKPESELWNGEVPEIIEKKYNKSTRDAFDMYIHLDVYDQAEIRGEMKHMLRAEKYSDQDDTLQNA